MKPKLTIATVLVDNFAQAFDNLCQDTTISVKDRYALAKTLRQVRAELEAYEQSRLGLFKKHGMPHAEVLKLQIEKATDENLKSKLQSQLEQIEKSKVPAWAINPYDEDKVVAFRQELKELQNQEFEIFLDHQIALKEGCGLTAKELDALIDLVTIE